MSQSKHDKFFSRALLMLQKLSSERSVNVIDLAEEYGVNKRTIYRDIQRLHFFPIELDCGIVKVVDGFNIEHSQIQDIELLIAELAFNSISGMNESVDKHLQSIRAKLFYPSFFSPYSIKPYSFETIDMDSELLNKMEDAIIKRNLSKVISNKTESLVEPYKVVAFDGFWYLLAKDTQDKKIKTYLVSSIDEFIASSKVYDSEYVDIDNVLQNVHTAWFEDGNSFEVQVKIKSQISHYFKRKKYLSSQTIIKENSDGSLIINFEVSTDEDVDNIIKAWLPHVEVVKPERFRKKLILELENYVRELKAIQYDL